MSRISILSGEIASGKTSLCLALADLARESEVSLGGLLSPAVFAGGSKVAIDVLDLKSGQRRRLADLKGEGPGGGLETRRWSFLPEAVAWGNQALAASVPCDLLLIDELGPLEFFQGTGWVNGFKALESGAFRAALIVIRPSLLEEAGRRWEVDRIFDLSAASQAPLPADRLFRLLLEG